MAQPLTRLPGGVSTDLKSQTLGNYILPNFVGPHEYRNDFDTYNAAEWIVTETQVGATQALIDEDGGVLQLGNSAADDDLNAIQKVGESFLFELGKRTWFKSRFKISDATQSELIVGLQITDTTPTDVTDGVFFQKADGTDALTLEVEKDNVATSTAVGTLVDDTYVTAGFFYDGIETIEVFLNDALVGKSVITNLPDDEVLTISLAVLNGEAAAKDLSIDYVLASKER